MQPRSHKLPKHLAAYFVDQNYAAYTPEEHATWRYIMRRNRAFFAEHAVPIYLEGLKKTGIPTERIPRIADIDACLAEFGYGAVCVRGFIPPAIFLEFQALGIMPIAADMRNVRNVGYTPAPDIVHEAAGHVPIVADPAYRHYLSKYGTIANKAIFSKEDVRLYEAIRLLSDIKENPDTDAQQIQQAERLLAEATAAVSYSSESTKVGRMGWWTIEYGLVGTPEQPKIYGAGLLSSVEESQNCLSPLVKKIPLTIDCVNQTYDITEPQPQLFIARSLEELPDSLAQLESSMSYVIGGIHGLETAMKAKTVNTIELNSGIQVGGVLEFFEVDSAENAAFLKMAGPTQIAVAGKVMDHQGHDYHAAGYSSPVGRFSFFPDRCPSFLGTSELRAAGIEVGKPTAIEFASGFRVAGRLRSMNFAANRLLLMTFDDCQVTRGSRVYYEPSWGPFDMIVGESVKSVFSGPPDRDAFGSYEIGTASSSPARTSPFSDYERRVFSLYEQLRQLRGSMPPADEAALRNLGVQLRKDCPREWLAALELLEICSNQGLGSSAWVREFVDASLRNEMGRDETTRGLIEKGIELLNVSGIAKTTL